MERPKVRPSTWAWAGTIGGIALYDALAPKGEQMSERADEWLKHPVKRRLVEAGMACVALHVCNRIPERFDPIHRLASLGRAIDDAMDVFPEDED